MQDSHLLQNIKRFSRKKGSLDVNTHPLSHGEWILPTGELISKLLAQIGKLDNERFSTFSLLVAMSGLVYQTIILSLISLAEV